MCWGHDTNVLEDNIRDFAGNWTGTGEITGAGDAERVELEDGEYMISETVNTGANTVTLLYNVYAEGDVIDLDYRTGATQAACESAEWQNYSTPFSSLGFVQARVSAP